MSFSFVNAEKTPVMVEENVASSENVAAESLTLTNGTALAEDLLAKCQILLNELEAFSTFVAEQIFEPESVAETRKFQNSVATELKSLKRVSSPSYVLSFSQSLTKTQACSSRSHRRENGSYPSIIELAILLGYLGGSKS